MRWHRVGSEHSLRTPKRCDELGRVGHRPADKIALERLQWVVASDAEVVCVADTDPAGAVLLGFGHGDVVCLWPDDETQTVVAIDRRHTGFLAGNLYLRPRIDSAQFEHLEIGMEPGDAVRIYSPQVALRQDIRCLLGIGFRHAEIHEHFGGEIAQMISRVHDSLLFVIHGERIEVGLGNALQEIIKEVIGIHVLLTRSLFGGGIPRRLLLRVSLAKLTSAPLPF
jgi:hypothetical protein